MRKSNPPTEATVGKASHSGRRATSHSGIVSLLKHDARSHADPLRHLTTRALPCVPCKDELISELKGILVKRCLRGFVSDVELTELASIDTQQSHGVNVSLHVVRKQLWNLTLRHILVRSGDSYAVSPAWRDAVLQALEAQEARS